ncbi:S-adenosyl-L-methionine-dependent methyltransferase [Sporodiniella umbellata]|nr:S-adenosyl-L-methionine-dependent methyltransferase [Sporodiniella umbellata]
MGTTQSRDDDDSRKHKRRSTIKARVRSSASFVGVKPIKHQVVLSDHAQPISPLSLQPSSFRKSQPSISTRSSFFEDDLHSYCTSEEADKRRKNEFSDIIFETKSDLVWKRPVRPFLAYNKNDEKEYERQLRQHYVLKHILKGNLHVPVAKESPLIILDSACGAGFWTLDTALDYPNATVIGLDAFPERHRPDNMMIGAPNIVYKAGDLTSQLQLPSRSVDVIYQRDTSTILPHHIWPVLLSELKRVAKPGAYIQLVEYNFSLKDPGPVLSLVNEWYRIASHSVGVDPSEAKQLNTFLVKAGFEEVKETVVRIPIGEWAQDEEQKENGFLYKQVIKALFYSMRTWWVSELDVSAQEYDKVVSAALQEFDEQRSSIEWIIYTARNPA